MCIFWQFKNGNGNPYRLRDSDVFACSIKHTATSTEISHVIEPLLFSGHEEIKVSFTARLSGDYCIRLNTSSGLITGSPQTRVYLPGEPWLYTTDNMYVCIHSKK